MKIVCADSVIHGADAFGTLGPVTLLPETAIRRADLLDAEALIVRSKTHITAELLAGTPVRFVGTATAGFDHIEAAELRARGIEVSVASGSNAESVAEYVVAALLRLAHKANRPLAGTCLGIIGVGEVGSRVASKAEALGMRVLLNDPPLAEAAGDPKYRPLAEVIGRADIVTLHVPLVQAGPHPTVKLADPAFFRQMRPGVWFINTARGEVVDEAALELALAGGMVGKAVLDVWDHEPAIDLDLMHRAVLATPHIAGYSWTGRVRGMQMVYQAACRFFNQPETWQPPAAGRNKTLICHDAGPDIEAALADLVRRVYDIEKDDRHLRAGLRGTPEECAQHFSRLRNEYPRRLEFSDVRVRTDGPGQLLAPLLGALGFAPPA